MKNEKQALYHERMEYVIVSNNPENYIHHATNSTKIQTQNNIKHRTRLTQVSPRQV